MAFLWIKRVFKPTDAELNHRYVAQWLWSSTNDFCLPLKEPWVYLEYISVCSWPPTPDYIPDPSHGRIFREKFCSVYMVKGIWSLLTDLLLNRFHPSPPYVCSRTWLTLIIARGNQTLACRWGFTRGPWLKQISNYIIYHIIKQRKMRDTAISLKFPPDFPLNFHADSRFTYNPNFPVDSPPTCIRHPRGFHAESAWFCPLVHVYLQR